MGVLGWPPSEFWNATPTELYSAIRGWQASQGIDPDEEDTGAALTRDELDDLMEQYPDGD